jgi:hypothetical protein
LVKTQTGHFGDRSGPLTQTDDGITDGRLSFPPASSHADATLITQVFAYHARAFPISHSGVRSSHGILAIFLDGSQFLALLTVVFDLPHGKVRECLHAKWWMLSAL